MKLRSASRVFFVLVLAALTANLLMLLLVRQAADANAEAVARRDAAHAQVDELLRESDLLSALVQGYTTTARTRYLDVYYAILAVRSGEKGPPSVDDPVAWWRLVAGGRAPLEGQPAGHLYFAGEHTDSFYSWQGFMEGACLSGLSASAAVLASMA